MKGNIATACGTIKIGFTIKFIKIVRVELFCKLPSQDWDSACDKLE